MDCIHHWVITGAEDTIGEWSHGQCKKCGATKNFRNTTPTPEFTDNAAAKERLRQERQEYQYQERYDN